MDAGSISSYNSIPLLDRSSSVGRPNRPAPAQDQLFEVEMQAATTASRGAVHASHAVLTHRPPRKEDEAPLDTKSVESPVPEGGPAHATALRQGEGGENQAAVPERNLEEWNNLSLAPSGLTDISPLPDDLIAPVNLMTFGAKDVLLTNEQIESMAKDIAENVGVNSHVQLDDRARDMILYLGPIGIVPNRTYIKSDQLSYIRNILSTIKPWTTTNVGRAALKQGLGSHYSFVIIQNTDAIASLEYPDIEFPNETFATPDDKTVCIRFDGTVVPSNYINSNGGHFTPEWATVEAMPATVRLFRLWLVFLKATTQGMDRMNHDYFTFVKANSQILPLADVQIAGLGQFSGIDQFSIKNLREELNLPKQTFVRSQSETGEGVPYPAVTYHHDGTVVPSHPSGLQQPPENGPQQPPAETA